MVLQCAWSFNSLDIMATEIPMFTRVIKKIKH